MFRVVDWLLDLPRELTQSFWQEIQQFEREKKMPVFTSTEEYLIDKGREEGKREGKRDALVESIAEGLKQKFGDKGAALAPSVKKIKSLSKLRALQKALWTIDSLDEVRGLLAGRSGRKP